jgi:L-malate glycosyltransferase
MKALVISIEYGSDLSGVGIACRRIVNGLKKKAEMHVLTFGSSKDTSLANRARKLNSSIEDGVHVHRISPYSGNLTTVPPQEIQNLCYYIELLHKEHKFNLFHGFNLSGSGFAAVYMGKRLGVASIASVRGNDVGRDIFDMGRLYGIRWTLENANLCTFVAKDLMDMAKPLAKMKAQVIHNGLDPFEFYFKDIKLKVDGFVVCYSGIVRQKKGFSYLAEAFATFSKDNPSTLFIVGELMPEEKLSYFKLFEELGILSKVMITGRIDHNIILNYLSLGDCFVLPSISEGCSNSMLEAMYAKKPVIATRIGAANEIIADRKDGLLVEPHSSKALLDALIALKKNKKLRDTLGLNAKQKVLKKHSTKIEAEDWLKAYRKCKR